MDLGMIGLGRMGSNMAQRLARGGHRIVGFDVNPKARALATEQGIECRTTLTELFSALPSPRVIWLMVPAGAPVDSSLDLLLPLLSPSDVVIDGGNSNYRDSQRRARLLEEHKAAFLDVGTSGGIWGLEQGYSLMIGGDAAIVARLQPLFATLAPHPNSGWGHVGPSGAGHFTKMIHNGIEYGLMQAYAEGFAVMRQKKELELNLKQIADIWRDGSVVRSWLLDLTSALLARDPTLNNIEPFVPDSGEGRWTVQEAIELNVAAPIITQSLLERLRSRDAESFADRMLAGLRGEFGGHFVKTS